MPGVRVSPRGNRKELSTLGSPIKSVKTMQTPTVQERARQIYFEKHDDKEAHLIRANMAVQKRKMSYKD